MPPKDFLQLIAKCLALMLARQLGNTPGSSPEEFNPIIEVMASDLFSVGYDCNYSDRIEDAFNFFALHSDRWPTPYDILETLKSRRSQIQPETNLLEKEKEKWIPLEKGSHSQAYELSNKITKSIQEKSQNEPIKTINDIDHARLSTEDSPRAILYRDMMRK